MNPKNSIINSKKKIYVIGDLHLDHTNIIKYCDRPFNSTEEMNKVIVDNWNNIVQRDDIVYFLGDLAFGRGSRSTDYWLEKLNGEITFIKGRHDRSKTINFLENAILEYKGKKFYLVHDPKHVPSNWDGWVIHGHHHNNYPKEFPFINGETKMINVSIEMIDYTPLNLDRLLELDFENIKYMKTINSKPVIG